MKIEELKEGEKKGLSKEIIEFLEANKGKSFSAAEIKEELNYEHTITALRVELKIMIDQCKIKRGVSGQLYFYYASD